MAGSDADQGAAAVAAQRRTDIWLTSLAALAWVLFAFRRAVASQLGSLHTPGARARTHGALHSGDLPEAIRTWTEGKAALASFQPLGHSDLIYQHTAVSAALAMVVGLFMILLLRRHTRGTRWATPVVGIYIVVSLLTTLVDLSIANGLGDNAVYGAWFRWLDLIPLLCLAVVVLAALPSLVTDLRDRGWARFRGAPASARLVLLVAVALFALCNAKDIGAQLEDLLRRDLTGSSYPTDLGQGALLLFGVGVFLAVLRVLNALRYDQGPEAPPKSALRLGLGLTVAGVAGWLFGTTLAPLLLGLLFLVIGLASDRWTGEEPFSRRAQLELRFAGAATLFGISVLVLGLAFGAEPHEGLVAAGLVAIALGGWFGIARLRHPDPMFEVASGPEGAALLVLAGVGVMAGIHQQVLPLRIGLALAILGTLLLVVSRQASAPRNPYGDPIALVLIGVGLRYAYAGPRVVALAAVVGVVTLLWNRTLPLPLPWVPGAGSSPTSSTAPVAPPVSDSDATGVLVVAAVLPITGLLTLCVRALAASLATGTGRPPLVLIGFTFALVAAAVVGSMWLSSAEDDRTIPAGRPRRLLWVPLAAVLAPWPILAGVSLASDDSAAARVGTAVGPLFLLVLLVAAVGAAGGAVRIATSRHSQPAAFRRLGFHRTPVNGLLLVWLLLVMVVGAPLERTGASSHNVRLMTPSQPASLDEGACEDVKGVLDAIRSVATPRQQKGLVETQVAGELCRWANRAMAMGATAEQGLPLVLVSASGGGVRAAAWTTRVLDCLLFPNSAGLGDNEGRCGPTDLAGSGQRVSRPDRWSFVFAMGGASGGSVGEATAVAQRLAPTDVLGKGWARDVAEHNHLGPVSGQMVLAELGLAWAGLAPEHDRAETLIDEWSGPFGAVAEGRCSGTFVDAAADEGEQRAATERGDHAVLDIEDIGFLQARAACPEQVPLLLFNGTVVRTGTRFDISPLDETGADGSVGLKDVLCRDGDGHLVQDVPFFDAAFMSGRFPLVTPSGRIGEDRPAACELDVSSPVDVVDGGYHENSGAAQIAELWTELGPLVHLYNEARTSPDHPSLPEIRPIFLQIENGLVTDDTPLECPSKDREEGRDPEPVLTGPTDASGDSHRDLAVRMGEPLRIGWAGFETAFRAPNDDDGIKDRLVRELCKDFPVVTMALYDHPGRALPLGWSLTDDVLDDLEGVFGLEANACRGRGFAAYVDGGPVGDREPECTPCPEPKEKEPLHRRCAGWERKP